MLTGGLRSASVMNEVLASGAVDVIGLARPLAVDPDFRRSASKLEQTTLG